ncbi:adenylate kinase [Rhizina undulata]
MSPAIREPLIQLSDYTAETLKKMLLTYYKQTAPVVDHYENKGIWRGVDAAGYHGTEGKPVPIHLNSYR